jgi:hypothetical protein
MCERVRELAHQYRILVDSEHLDVQLAERLCDRAAEAAEAEDEYSALVSSHNL